MASVSEDGDLLVIVNVDGRKGAPASQPAREAPALETATPGFGALFTRQM